MTTKYEGVDLDQPKEKPRKKKNPRAARELDVEPMSVAEAAALVEDPAEAEEVPVIATEANGEATPVSEEEVAAAAEALAQPDTEGGEGFHNMGSTFQNLPDFIGQKNSGPVVGEVVKEEKSDEVEKPQQEIAAEIPTVEESGPEIKAPVAEKPQTEIAPKIVAAEKSPKVPVQEKKNNNFNNERKNIHRPEKQPHGKHEQQDAARHERQYRLSEVEDKAKIEKWFKTLAAEEKTKKEGGKKLEQKNKTQEAPKKISIPKGSDKLPSFWERLTGFVASLGPISRRSKPKFDGRNSKNKK